MSVRSGYIKPWCSLSKTVNLSKNKIAHYTLLLWGEMSGRLCKVRFNLLRIQLDSGATSSIVLGKYTQKMLKKKIKTVHCSTQGDHFNNNYTSKV